MMTETKTANDLLEQISRKLDKLIGVIAIQGKEKNDQIGVLVSLGFTNLEISKITGIPKGTIDWTRAKKKKGVKKSG